MTNLSVNDTADSHSNLHSIMESSNEKLIYNNGTQSIETDDCHSIIHSFFMGHIRARSANKNLLVTGGAATHRTYQLYLKYSKSLPSKNGWAKRMKMSLKAHIMPSSKYSRQNVATMARISDGRPGLFTCLCHLLWGKKHTEHFHLWSLRSMAMLWGQSRKLEKTRIPTAQQIGVWNTLCSWANLLWALHKK